MARRITEYERQILEYTRRVEDRNGNLDAFAGRVAHDLKNTLAPAIIWPQVLRRSAGDEARVREIADNTERCTVRAVAVVDALLAFSRASQEPADDESTSLRAAASGVLDGLARGPGLPSGYLRSRRRPGRERGPAGAPKSGARPADVRI